MKGLKITIWTCAIAFLLEFIFVLLPWKMIASVFYLVSVRPPVAYPVTVFLSRLSLAMMGAIGVFLLILAFNPLKYGAMLSLACYGLLCWGAFWFFGGVQYGLPLMAYFLDTILGIGGGTFILIFWKKAT